MPYLNPRKKTAPKESLLKRFFTILPAYLAEF